MDNSPPTDTPITRPIAAARRHASMFSPIEKKEAEKQGATNLVVDSFLFALHYGNLREYCNLHDHYKSMRSCTSDDPPDVLLTRNDDKVVGIELTELVDAKSAKAASPSKTNPKNKRPRKNKIRYEPREYTDEQLHAELSAIIAHKDTKPFKHPCDKRVLLIYSDEPTLRTRTDILQLVNQKPLPNSFFDQIYLMLPARPNTSGDIRNNEGDRLFLISGC
jgi:hypothetical protein